VTIKSGEINWKGYVAQLREMIIIYTIFVPKSED
jgi:hypothetical protein